MQLYGVFVLELFVANVTFGFYLVVVNSVDVSLQILFAFNALATYVADIHCQSVLLEMVILKNFS